MANMGNHPLKINSQQMDDSRSNRSGASSKLANTFERDEQKKNLASRLIGKVDLKELEGDILRDYV